VTSRTRSPATFGARVAQPCATSSWGPPSQPTKNDAKRSCDAVATRPSASQRCSRASAGSRWLMIS
jgi:hypothetical protein